MDFKLSDFFVGVIDFFSVLLPGTLVIYFLMGIFYDDVIGPGKIFPSPDNEIVKWVFVAVVAYVIGNIIFMIGSFLDRIYDRYLRQFFQTKHDLAYRTARNVQRAYIDTDAELVTLLSRASISDQEYRDISQDRNREIFNTYKWAQHLLSFKSADASQDIRRIEADQKFFRSLVVSFVIIAAVLLLRGKNPPSIALIVLVLAVLSLYR